ncbi:MAG: hypothetical protein R3F62_06430 [Planctomycetota bacterium]
MATLSPGLGASRVLAAEVEVTRPGPAPQSEVYAQSLAHELGLELKQVEGVVHKGQLASGERLEGRGVSVRFAQLRVTRLRFRRAPDALGHAVYLTRAERTWSLASVRALQTVLLQGPALENPQFASRVLAAAWSVGNLRAPRARPRTRSSSPTPGPRTRTVPWPSPRSRSSAGARPSPTTRPSSCSRRPRSSVIEGELEPGTTIAFPSRRTISSTTSMSTARARSPRWWSRTTAR